MNTEVVLKANGSFILVKKKDHEHRHKTASWDEKLLGPQVVNITKTHATHKLLHVCRCGDKIVEQVRHMLPHASTLKFLREEDARRKSPRIQDIVNAQKNKDHPR